MIKIKCPKCGRILGDTKDSIDCTINCKDCGAQRIIIKVAKFDYAKFYKGENHDKSK